MATKRKNPKRVAAGKKAARTRKRSKSTPTRRRRRTTRSKSFLSEMFNPKMAQAGAKAVVSGGVGGAAAVGVIKMTPNLTPLQRFGLIGGGSFMAATLMKMPNVGAGMMGVGIYTMMENAGMLSEDGFMDANYVDPIEQLPPMLGENDMYALSQGEFALAEDYEVGYYPQGFGGRG